MYYVGNIQAVETDIQHFGILGMKWGVRRYQNKDGTLTPEGKKRYNEAAKMLYDDLSSKNRNYIQEQQRYRDNIHAAKAKNVRYLNANHRANLLTKEIEDNHSKYSKDDIEKMKRERDAHRSYANDVEKYIYNTETTKFIKSLEKAMSETTINRLSEMNVDRAQSLVLDIVNRAGVIQDVKKRKGKIWGNGVKRELIDDSFK